MSYNLRLPNITGPTDRERLAQIQRYLFSLTEQLQWALNNLDASSANVVTQQPKSTLPEQNYVIDAPTTFNAIKSLIIKSADVVNAYYEEISKRLEGEYVATSDFGTYKEQTSQQITANSAGITSIYTNLQQIVSDIGELENDLLDINAYIRSGLLYTDENGIPIYGVEVGQKNTVDDVEVFNQYARFTASKLSFYDHNGIEVAYISDYKLYITHVEILGSVRGGGFLLDLSKGIRLKHVGRG